MSLGYYPTFSTVRIVFPDLFDSYVLFSDLSMLLFFHAVFLFFYLLFINLYNIATKKVQNNISFHIQIYGS